MPAHSGVSLKLKPCWGSQIPCSQMISMNSSPPRSHAARNVESVPNVNARIRNSDRRNIGSATARSMNANAARQATPAPSSEITSALPQLQVGPDGAEQPDRHRDQEHEPPVDRGEQSAEHEPDEHPAHADDVVDAERHPALVGGERVGDDRGGVGQQERRADALHDPEDDQVDLSL